MAGKPKSDIPIVQKEDYCLVKVGPTFEARNHVDVRQAANRAIGMGCTKLVFDVSECGYIDSSAIGLMVEMYRRLNPQGRRVGLLKPTENVRRIIGLTRTDTLIAIYGTEESIAADESSTLPLT
jgi:anti-sigma B factor antagonist